MLIVSKRLPTNHNHGCDFRTNLHLSCAAVITPYRSGQRDKAFGNFTCLTTINKTDTRGNNITCATNRGDDDDDFVGRQYEPFDLVWVIIIFVRAVKTYCHGLTSIGIHHQKHDTSHNSTVVGHQFPDEFGWKIIRSETIVITGQSFERGTTRTVSTTFG